MSDSKTAADRIEPYVWKIAGVVILGMTMSILDTTIVNVALDTLGKDLHATIAQIQWVATGYLLALAAVIPLTGWAARRYGAKRALPPSCPPAPRPQAPRARTPSSTLNGSWGRPRSRRGVLPKKSR